MRKRISVFLIFIWSIFSAWLPGLQVRALLGPALAEAASTVTDVTAPSSTDLSTPTGTVKFEWARVAGRKGAVYLNIPSNQLGNRINLPSSPAPVILAKYSPLTATGQIAVMRLRMVGGTVSIPTATLQAMILQIMPQNFQTYMGPDLYRFAFLNYNNENCDVNNSCGLPTSDTSAYVDPQTGQTCTSEYAQKALCTPGTCTGYTPPDVSMSGLVKTFHGDMNLGGSSYNENNEVAQIDGTLLASQQAAVNKSPMYWDQRLNNDPCWHRVGLQELDNGSGDGLFHNVSLSGFENLVALAQHYQHAPISFIAMADVTEHTSTSQSGGFISHTVSTTHTYTLYPRWTVGTRFITGMETPPNGLVNPTQDPNDNYSFVPIQPSGTFPQEPFTIDQFTYSQSGFSGLFVFIASVVLGALTGGAGGLALGSMYGVAAGAGAGAIGGLIATGGSPTLSQTAKITPFQYSAYSLAPAVSGEMASVSSDTQSEWLDPAPQLTTPVGSGVSEYVTEINYQRAMGCGGAGNTVNCTTTVATIPMSDPRFKTVMSSMFNFPNKILQQSVYPYTTP